MSHFVDRYLGKWKRIALPFARNCKGQDMIEYALLAGFMAVAASAVMPTNIQSVTSTIFSKLNASLITSGS